MNSPIDPSLISAIKGFEGFTPRALWDQKQFSVGYGTRAQSPNETIDPTTAEQRLGTEVSKAASTVDGLGVPMPAGVRNALISLTYNTGDGWTRSGLGEKVKAQDWDGAQSKLLQYNHAGGEVSPGLTARRQQEASWFNQPAGDGTQPQQPPQQPAMPVAPQGVQSLSGGPPPAFAPPATADAAPSGAPPASAGASSPSAPPGMLQGMLDQGQQPDPALALLQQHAAQMMQEQPEQPPPMASIAMPQPRGMLAARLRAAALGRGFTGGV